MKTIGIGIDGCKDGWIVASIAQDLSCTQIERIEHLSVYTAPGNTPIWIDMPIGLPTKRTKQRLCDSEARALLKKRSSTIFTPPTRRALLSKDYTLGSNINFQTTGKKISKQAWNIGPKILEVAVWTKKLGLYESHPELCFYGLNDSTVVMSSKHTPEGLKERAAILSRYTPNLKVPVQKAKQDLQAKEDDIIDAIALGISSALIRLKTAEEIVLGTEEHQIRYCLPNEGSSS